MRGVLLVEEIDAFSPGLKENVRPWDRIHVLGSIPPGIALLVVPALDAVRFGWSSVPLAAQVAEFGILAVCLLIYWAMRGNTWLSRIVEIQKDMGHSVTTTGPYHVVRHTMYCVVILMFLGLPLALASLRGLVPGAVLAAMVLIRNYLEDLTLYEELEGYREYARQTRFRLIPG